MKSNWQLRILAILLAFFIWYLVSGQEKVETWIEIPVEMVNLPEDLLIREGMISRIKVRIRGSKGIVRGLNPQGMAYTMDLGELEQGTRVLVFDPKNISVSQPLQVIEIRPSRVELVIDALLTKEVPVELKWKADLQKYYELKSKEIKPDQVRIQGPEAIVNPIDKIATQLVQIKEPVLRQWTKRVSLDIPAEVKVEPAQVQVELKFGPETKVMWVKRPIKLKTPESIKGIKMDPQEVRLKLKLPVPLLRQEDWRKQIRAKIPITEEIKEGRQQLRIQVDLPEDTMLIASKPEVAEVVVPSAYNSTKKVNSQKSKQGGL